GPAAAEAAGQQLTGPGLGEQVQVQRVRAFGGDQAGEVVAAGDDGQAPGRAGQQRPYLLGVSRVVQHYQDALASEQAAVESHLVRMPPPWAVPGRILSRLASSAPRPPKAATAGGSCAGTSAAGAAGMGGTASFGGAAGGSVTAGAGASRR